MFTYDFTTAPNLSRVRLLIADTVEATPIFEDEEVDQALYLTSSQAINPQANQVYSVRLAAAMLLESLAANKARLAAVQQLLDVQLDASKAAIQLRELAKQYRTQEANSGAFAFAEMCPDAFSARERKFNELLRA